MAWETQSASINCTNGPTMRTIILLHPRAAQMRGAAFTVNDSMRSVLISIRMSGLYEVTAEA
jgi:hypothetical protein